MRVWAIPVGLSCQRRLQQATCARLRLCQPCVPVFSKRVSGLITGRFAHGFTLCCFRPPRFSAASDFWLLTSSLSLVTYSRSALCVFASASPARYQHYYGLC